MLVQEIPMILAGLTVLEAEVKTCTGYEQVRQEKTHCKEQSTLFLHNTFVHNSALDT